MALLLHHRTKPNTFTLTITNPSLLRRLFSVDGGGGGGDDQPPSNSKSPFSSYFRDVKESLKQRKPSPLPSTPSVEEIQRNLSEFRRRTSPPPPPTDTPFSFQDLYNHRNVSQKPDQPAGDPVKKPGGGKYSFDAIRASLNQINISPRGGGRNGRMSSTVMNTEFVKIYGYEELGEKLKKLRPEGKAKEWFSIGELNERLMRLREMEANEPQKDFKGLSFTDLRESLIRMQNSEVGKGKKSSQN